MSRGRWDGRCHVAESSYTWDSDRCCGYTCPDTGHRTRGRTSWRTTARLQIIRAKWFWFIIPMGSTSPLDAKVWLKAHRTLHTTGLLCPRFCGGGCCCSSAALSVSHEVSLQVVECLIDSPRIIMVGDCYCGFSVSVWWDRLHSHTRHIFQDGRPLLPAYEDISHSGTWHGIPRSSHVDCWSASKIVNIDIFTFIYSLFKICDVASCFMAILSRVLEQQRCGMTFTLSTREIGCHVTAALVSISLIQAQKWLML